MTTPVPSTSSFARGQSPHSTLHATPVQPARSADLADTDEDETLVTDGCFATTDIWVEDNAHAEIPDDPEHGVADTLADRAESTTDRAETSDMPPLRCFTTRARHAAGDYGVYTAVVIPLAAPWVDGDVDILS